MYTRETAVNQQCLPSVDSCPLFCIDPVHFVSGGLLQPPVRLVSQPQPARRLDPPSRFSGRNDRGGDPMPNRKDDRRYVDQTMIRAVHKDLASPRAELLASRVSQRDPQVVLPLGISEEFLST